jgi:hypothetical protein
MIASVVPPVIQIDEQAETDEFVDAMTAEEAPFTPDSADWFDCVLKSALSGGRDVVGELDNGQWVIINERDFTTKDQGHSLCLKGRQAWVRLELNASAHRHHYLYRATEAQIKVIGSGKERIRGSGTIIVWNASMGAAKMPCGCSIQVGTSSRDEQLDLQFGDEVQFEIYFSTRLQKWLGNITAC